MAIVTLTTDFGTRDPYVGAMKGAVLAVAEYLHLVDLSHEVAPQDLLEGGYILRHATPTFPAGTVHLGVVDPGVGSDRRALAIDDGHHRWVGPDNGLFTHVLAQERVRVHVVINQDLYSTTVSATFHGRDIFAPIAAHLACGNDVATVGPAIDDAVHLAQAGAEHRDGALYGHVLHIDRFGNLITTIDASRLAPLRPVGAVVIESTRIDGLVTTYSDVACGEIAALIGSGDLLEIGQRAGSAARLLGIKRGARVIVHPRKN